MLGVRCVAMKSIPRLSTALLISFFCWLSHRSLARKRGDNFKGQDWLARWLTTVDEAFSQ